ncbi:organic radical activating enzyme [Paenibacillus castaneae]|uniref:STM4011 family radical SAM protein n=1 Tax=Paenibacillus castaneae TaxID=474957 RepID=UPI000C9B9004|nr:STM4011 family radical SAM protein [Paenibacillus castaneae]NIK78817.1 organic radical activating enzyme [Paenibacillus castaneae]
MKATLYYRGVLSSCNYDCPYCPFSKTKDSRATLEKDKEQLQAFMDWVRGQETAGHKLSIFFNPYGEALVHRWYLDALIELSHMSHVDKVAVQTNLSVKLDWTEQLNREKAAFWATYHPGQTTEEQFVKQCMKLYDQKIAFSVGIVGVRSAFDAIAHMRSRLPKDIYLWINAFKDQKHYYTSAEIDQLTGIDPYFQLNATDYDSFRLPCDAGSTVFYVQGSGMVKRCYSDRRVIGHLYRDGLEGLSAERPCGMKKCGCYIGYIHMPQLSMKEIYAEGLLERIPAGYAARS